MLGLLGTVTGMIIAFGEISVAGTGNPGLLAGGIGQALVTTAAGLIVAIPVLIGQNYLASRVDTILMEIDRRREELMANVVQAVAARKEPSSAEAADAGSAETKTAARRPAPRPAPGARSEMPAADQAPLPFGAEPPVPSRAGRLRVEPAGGDGEGVVVAPSGSGDRNEPRS